MVIISIVVCNETSLQHESPRLKCRQRVQFYVIFADVAKLVDAPDLGSGVATREGSSPFIRTMIILQGSWPSG